MVAWLPADSPPAAGFAGADRTVGAERRHREFRIALTGFHRQQLEIAAAGMASPPASVSSVDRRLSTLAAHSSAINWPAPVLLDLVELPLPQELHELIEIGQERRLTAADRDARSLVRCRNDSPSRG